MRYKIKKTSIDKILWTLYAFILIFSPPFMPYPHLALALWSVLLLATKYKSSFKKIFHKSGGENWGLTLILVGMYTIVVPFILSLFFCDVMSPAHYMTIINRFGVLLFTILPCSTLMLAKIKKDKLDYHFFVETVISAGVLQGCCAILSYFSSDIKHIFIMLMRRFAGSSIFDNDWFVTVRSYGFARSLVDLFGLGIALLAGLSFFYGITEKRRYIFYSIIIAAAALLNSRTGIILYIIAIIISFFYLMKTGAFKPLATNIISIFILTFFSKIALDIISHNSYTSGWLAAGFDSIKYFIKNKSFSGASGDSLGNLFMNQSWILPGNIRTIFGTAHSLYQADGYLHSDVGYINDIWIFGILGCIFVYGSIFKEVIYVLKKSNNILFRFTMLYFSLCFILFNFKGAAIGYNTGATVLLLFLFAFRYFTCQQKENFNI